MSVPYPTIRSIPKHLRQRSHIALLTLFGALALFLKMPGFCFAETSVQKNAPENNLLGTWTVVHSEVDGDATASLRNPGGRPSTVDGRGGAFPPVIWKIGREEIQAGWENLNFPSFRYQCQWNPGGKMGTVDLTSLDKEGKKMHAEAMKGIYLLKDDVLTICHVLDNAPRPEHFTTAAKSKSVLLILRRGKGQVPGR